MTLDELEELLAAASPGPWDARAIQTEAIGADDAALIAALRNAAPGLIEEHRRTRAFLEEKDGAYRERNQLVAALSKLFPASLELVSDPEPGWTWGVYVDLPTGQASWHIHDSELVMFDHLPRGAGREWDGHTTAEKYERLRALLQKEPSRHLTREEQQICDSALRRSARKVR